MDKESLQFCLSTEVLRHSAGNVGTYDVQPYSCTSYTLITFITNSNALYMLKPNKHRQYYKWGIPNSLTRGECGEAGLHTLQLRYKLHSCCTVVYTSTRYLAHIVSHLHTCAELRNINTTDTKIRVAPTCLTRSSLSI